jgi:hypothetical protein
MIMGDRGTKINNCSRFIDLLPTMDVVAMILLTHTHQDPELIMSEEVRKPKLVKH